MFKFVVKRNIVWKYRWFCGGKGGAIGMKANKRIPRHFLAKKMNTHFHSSSFSNLILWFPQKPTSIPQTDKWR